MERDKCPLNSWKCSKLCTWNVKDDRGRDCCAVTVIAEALQDLVTIAGEMADRSEYPEDGDHIDEDIQASEMEEENAGDICGADEPW